MTIDPRIPTLVWVIVVTSVYSGIARAGLRVTAETIHDGNWYARAIIYSILGLLLIPVAAWVDQTLWNMVAEPLGLPTIDLITALAGGMLVLSLFWSTSGLRTVRVHVDRNDVFGRTPQEAKLDEALRKSRVTILRAQEKPSATD